METAKLFINGGSQAVRLPKEFSFPELTEVYIHRCGNKIILEPTKLTWSNLRKGLDMLPDDFDFKRKPPDFTGREDMF